MDKSIRDVIDAALWLREVDDVYQCMRLGWDAHQEIIKTREMAIDTLCLAVGNIDED